MLKLISTFAFVIALVAHGTASAEPRQVTFEEVLAMLIDAEPNADASPWRGSYDATAQAISAVANESPIFDGDSGRLRTAALFASLQWFESNGNPAARGDCRKQDEKHRCLGDPQSFGLYQIGRSNFASLGVDEEIMTGPPYAQTIAARKMIAISFAICRGRAEDDLLGQYASGGSTCAGIEKSGHRMRKAKWLFDRARARAAK